ncbi:branched-chain amino acid ABC transporter permease [Neopusillimonas aromaticivorans]|uniref:branched-chain amino acid ABC transporter permease n=1 Tax=Neopusillimonas aromaticivorans TaxID=2979868 RepID=UPI00259627C4|nr:branched-chain amino acid ABC transporter permease [Neopusillimonas aromaticivorans]WJJ94893.1 branched-chain amino acid ABC transporter permease [Neopusillimonas aromaticivorans]
MAYFFQILISGLLVGCIYAMAALGFTIVFNATRVINFANGEFLMLGGMATAALAISGSGTFPPLVAVVIAVIATTLVGVAMHALAFNKAKSRDLHMLVMLTIGLTLMIRGGASLVFGRDVHFVDDFGFFSTVVLGGVFIPSQGVWIALSLAAVGAALWFLFNRTTIGRAMQAASMEPRAAALCGIEPRTMAMLAFAIAGCIGGFAGALLAPITPPFYENGIMLGLKGFAGAIAGGLGNPLGAVLGGILIGVIESASAGYGASGYKDAISFLLLVVVLIVRPSGLLGKAAVNRV